MFSQITRPGQKSNRARPTIEFQFDETALLMSAAANSLWETSHKLPITSQNPKPASRNVRRVDSRFAWMHGSIGTMVCLKSEQQVVNINLI